MTHRAPIAPTRHNGPFKFAHFSDPHLPIPAGIDKKILTPKQRLGWSKWRRSRSHSHDPAKIEACLHDLAAQGVQHLCITGDLVHLGTPPEIEAAARWLDSLRQRGFICHLVPGNHDAMTATAKRAALSAWYPTDNHPPAQLPAFPYCHDAGPVSFIGLDTAHALPVGLACGYLDASQLDRFEDLLAAAKRAGRFRVVLLHHSPVRGVESSRRRLYGGHHFRRILARHGAGLLLHGHVRQALRTTIPGPDGPVPVFGATSISEKSPDAQNSANPTIFTLDAADEPAASFAQIDFSYSR